MVYNGKSGWFGGTFRTSIYIYNIYGYLWIATADGACHSPSLAGLPSSCSRSITCPCGPVAEVEPRKTCCNREKHGKTQASSTTIDLINGDMGMGPNPIPLVNIKIAGKSMFLPLKMVCIGIDPYPYGELDQQWSTLLCSSEFWSTSP